VKYGISITSPRPFADVLESVRSALAAQGFGIVAEIDMQATLKKKIDVDIPSHMILGACNPQAARHAFEVEPSIALLLPCNVVVRQAEGHVVVEAIDTQMMAEVTGNEAMKELADEIGARLRSALDTVVAA
jgi:uncharacterized protein (DUF302 family)